MYLGVEIFINVILFAYFGFVFCRWLLQMILGGKFWHTMTGMAFLMPIYVCDELCVRCEPCFVSCFSLMKGLSYHYSLLFSLSYTHIFKWIRYHLLLTCFILCITAWKKSASGIRFMEICLVRKLSQLLKAVDEVSLEDIASIGQKLLSSPLTMASYGDGMYPA